MTGASGERKTTSRMLQEALCLGQGQETFPWQVCLLERFLRAELPSAVDIPTGLGKTAVMAIWLVARAGGAELPRRLVYVVDRRAVVDQATTEAERLRRWVAANGGMHRALGLTRPFLPISTLRGQHVDNREWLEDPASPAVIVGTVDMVGSRLLFEGYGVTRKMRPYHAGLLGSDSLIVLDEAHLVPPFERLLETIASGASDFGPAGAQRSTPVPRMHLLSLSATGRSSGGATHGLTERDLGLPKDHPLTRRLNARKHLVLCPLEPEGKAQEKGKETPGDLMTTLARKAWALPESNRQARILIYCDSRKDAGKVKREIERLAAGDKKRSRPRVAVDTELFVGGRRVFEREHARKRLEELGFLANNKVPREKPAFLIATSAAEVGVDVDADHMVCDLVAWERMVQRLGRVNRRGEGDATVVVLVQPTKKEQPAVAKRKRGEDLEEEECKLADGFEARQGPYALLPKDGRGFDASPGALQKLKQKAERDPKLKELLDAATTPAPLRPALTRALVDAWSLTSLEAHPGRPAIDPWLRGWVENDPPQTAVIWRSHLPIRSAETPSTEKEIEAFFEAAAPHASEKLETETFRVIEWLRERAKRLVNRATKGEEDLPDQCEVLAVVLARDGRLRRTLRVEDLEAGAAKGAEKRRNKKEIESALSGATLVLDRRVAGLKDGLLDETQDDLPRTVDDGNAWLGDGVVRFRLRPATADAGRVNDAAWRERLRFPVELSKEGETLRWLIVDKWRHDAANEEDRSSARPQRLDEHEEWAEDRARALAGRLGLEEHYTEMLAFAAALHDEGKRARRWQRAFNAPTDGDYAKTRGPINYALLDGYRHELGSLPCAENDGRLKDLPEELQDLALHLIAVHHGFGRPVIGTSGCEDAPPSIVELRARKVALRFARLQHRWGPWGLAWWESLLRAADQQASRDNDAREAAP